MPSTNEVGSASSEPIPALTYEQRATDDEAALRVQRQQVSALKARETEIRQLYQRERTLEVECIAAAVALRAQACSSAKPHLPRGQASEIIQTLDHIRALERARMAGNQPLVSDQTPPSDTRAELDESRRALLAWLEAPRAQELYRTRRALWATLLAVLLGASLAAFTVHPTFLLLLLPLGPIFILLRPGQDTEWRRLGARLRFKATGLEAPSQWNAPSVRQRLAELETAMASPQLPATALDEAFQDETTEHAAASLADPLTQQSQHLAALLTAGGLDPNAFDAALEQQLRLITELERSQDELAEAQQARKTAAAEANQIRERVFAYLAHRGTPPPAGHADTAALTAALDRLNGRRHGGQRC